MLILRLSLLLILCCYPNAFALLFNSKIFATIPKHWYSVGDSVEIYCNTTNEHYDDLYFSDLGSNLKLDDTRVNYSVKNVNKNTIILQLYNVTAGEYNYVCQSNQTKRDPFDIGVASFQVGYPPKIKSLSFESADFNQLSLFIKTPRDPHQYWKTTWKLSENSSKESVYDQCSCLNESNSCLCEDTFHCTISGESCFDPNTTYQFTILGSNHFGLLNQTYFISPTLKIVKLKQLTKLETFAAVSSLNISWSWKLQDLWPSSVIECNVSYQTPTGEWKNNVTDENEMTFNDLVPDTRYLLALRCKLQSSDYWSNVIQVYEKTCPSSSSDVSLEDLKIFDITNCDLNLSWKSPPANSNVLYYFVTYKAVNGPEEFAVLLPSQEFKLRNLNSSTHYNLAVALCNRNGCSRKKSHIQFTTQKLNNVVY